MYSSDELKEALLSQGSFAQYWISQQGMTKTVRLRDVVTASGHTIPQYIPVTVVEVYGTPSYDSYGYLESAFEAGIVFKIEDEYWKVVGAGGSYGIHFGDWWDDGNESKAEFRRVTKRTRTVSDYV